MLKKTSWFFVIALALLLLLVKLPSFEMPLDPDSGANAFFARQMQRGEYLYDKYHPAHHLPGIYYTFELAFNLFGDHPNSPKLLLLPWTLACAMLLYFMGRMYFDEQTGVLGAVFFVLVSSQRWVTGMTVEMEHFANLPLVAGIFLLFYLLRKPAQAWQFIWLGVLGAICVLYKVTFVAPLAVASISIILVAWITKSGTGVWKTMFYRLIWMAVGLVVPLACVAGYFASVGLWERFLLVFKLGLFYMDNAAMKGGFDMPRPFGYSLFWMSVNNIALLLFGLLATYRLIRRSIRLRTIDNVIDIALAFWLIISLALAGMRGGGFPHYVLPAVPALAIMAAIEINSIHQRWTLSSKERANLGRSIFIALVVLLFLQANHVIYRDYAMYKFNQISHDDFLQNIVEDGFASQHISRYIESHTGPNDLIYLWSNNVETYYYSDRMPPIDFLWPQYFAASGSTDQIFVPQTKYVVLDKQEKIVRPQWLLDGLAANYELEIMIDDREVYRRSTH